jgi:RNA recognition motif-containing protein
MNIFVGNLSKEVTEEDLNLAFSEFGQVKSSKVIRDLFSRESKGFGFVEMPGLAEAQKAIAGLNTREIKGKKITVNEARPKPGGTGGGHNNRRGGGQNQGGRRF